MSTAPRFPAGVGVPCARHADVETFLRCNRCETPICPKCLVQTPVGARCPDCGRARRPHTYHVSPKQALIGIGTALGVAALIEIVVSLLPFGGWIRMLVLAGIGYACSEAVFRTTRYKRGRLIIACTIVGMLMGLIAGRVILIASFGRVLPDPVALVAAATLGLFASIVILVGLGLAIAVIVTRMR